jgi:hypothetical protein
VDVPISDRHTKTRLSAGFIFSEYNSAAMRLLLIFIIVGSSALALDQAPMTIKAMPPTYLA